MKRVWTIRSSVRAELS